LTRVVDKRLAHGETTNNFLITNHFFNFALFFEIALPCGLVKQGSNEQKLTKSMKKVLLKSGILFAAFLMFANVAQAQKFGYVNSGLLVSELPEMKVLQSTLEALQTQLKKKGDAAVADYKKQEQAAVQKKQRGEMTPKEEEETMAALQAKQDEIYKMGADMEKQLGEKQQEGMKPILEKVDAAIKEVATEGGFQYIFDTQAGVILYADETADVTDLVKAKINQ